MSTPTTEQWQKARDVAEDHAAALDHECGHPASFARLQAAIAQALAEESAVLREERDARRQSLANEIRGCLKSRGVKWLPENAADLIPAVGQALDAAAARADAAEQERDEQRAIAEHQGHAALEFERRADAAELDRDHWKADAHRQAARADAAEQEMDALRAALEQIASAGCAYCEANPHNREHSQNGEDCDNYTTQLQDAARTALGDT